MADAVCRACKHPRAAHYVAKDPTTPSMGLDAVFCDVDSCLCWERYAIARTPQLSKMTAELKPARPTAKAGTALPPSSGTDL